MAAAPLPMALGLQHSCRRLLMPSNPAYKHSLSSLAARPRSALLAANSLYRVRHASSSSTATTATASASASSAAAASAAARTANPSPPEAMDWNKFFRLRTSRRRYSLISSAIGALLSTTGTMYALVEHQDQAENILKLVPTDPIVSTGIAVVAATFLGWLLGPMVGNSVWRLVHRKGLADFTVKEKTFFERIKKHRVNPSGAGANNPVPDFYGEKIGSVAGYRRWLKDQRAFNRKRGGNYVPATV